MSVYSLIILEINFGESPRLSPGLLLLRNYSYSCKWYRWINHTICMMCDVWFHMVNPSMPLWLRLTWIMLNDVTVAWLLYSLSALNDDDDEKYLFVLVSIALEETHNFAEHANIPQSEWFVDENGVRGCKNLHEGFTLDYNGILLGFRKLKSQLTTKSDLFRTRFNAMRKRGACSRI